MANRWLKLAYLMIFLGCLCVVQPFLRAQTPSVSDSPVSDPDKPWTATSDQQNAADSNPIRTTETHSVTDGRTVDKQTLERRGDNGGHEPYLDVETESERVDATTARTVERSFGRDPDGQKHLVQVTEEETRTLPSGEQTVVRTVSNPDVNGHLQIVRRESQDAKQISPSVRETKTTTLSPNANGDLVPIAQTEQRETRSNDNVIKFRSSTSLPDGNGHWQVSEIREGETQEENGKDRVKEERVSRPDLDGKFAVVERTVTKEMGSGPGDKRQTVETYSTEIPGTSGDGSLHLNRRVTTVNRPRSDGGNVTEEQVEERNPGAPGDIPRITQKTIDIIRPSAGGTTSETKTIQSLDSNGNLGVVWIDTGKTDKSSTVQVDTRTPPKPQ